MRDAPLLVTLTNPALRRGGGLRNSRHLLNTMNLSHPFLLLLLVQLLPAQPASKRPDAPLPAGVSLKDALGRDNGVRFVDLNGDGFDDLVLSNSERYAIYLFNDIERKNLGWTLGWPHIIREGKAGDANALPPIVTAEGRDAGVTFRDGALWVKGVRRFSFAELCRPPLPPARTPQESLKALRVKPGFRAELVASEPLVQDPIFVDWGADGRMWVVEMADYPFHEHKGRTFPGRVKVLTDTDGDGIYDKATVFLDGLLYPTGLAVWKNGVFIASVPDVFFAEDTDGDGRADKRTHILRGFTAGNPQHLVNGFAWGLDGWLYGGNGDSGGRITEVRSGKTFDLSGRDFRFNPATGEFQLQAGKAQYGRWRDDFGNWFANNNSNLGWHYLLDDRYLARNPRLAVPTVRRDLNRGGNRLFPVSAPIRRLNQPDSVNMLTSGCSLIPYRDTLFGADYAGSVFICEPANNLVHREVLAADGITFNSHRAADEAGSEFLASEDNWSRFTQARTGPDGCLYVVDFYRLILEHPEWIPRQMLEHLDLRAGSDMGRIYRISPGNTPRRAVPRLAALDDAGLGQQLASPNGWVRDTAQRLLLERGAKWSAAALSGSAAAQVQQLWTMHTLGKLQPAQIQTALRSPEARLREHAVRIAETHLRDTTVLATVCDLIHDDDVRVRVQVAFSLGESADARIPATLSALAQRDAATPGMLVALLSSAPQHADARQWQAMLRGTVRPTNIVPPKIITNADPDREKVVKAYAGVGKLIGDPARGHPLYTTLCAACHRLKNEGNEIGPDLGTIADKPAQQLIEAILDPSRAVEQRYLAQTLLLKNGEDLTGMIAEETANSITLKLVTGTTVVLRSDIARRTTSTKSLMPDGLESALTPQQLADLLAWIRAR
ncbi:MAG: c-type cytochrome [Verrucomicrobia bacterium]|nr:c-type cytochrome [Verrucomicrobiota bacterium]